MHDGLGHGIGLEPPVVRDAARGFDHETKLLWRGLRQSQHRGLRRIVEGMLISTLRQPFGVPREHGLRLELLGIEAALAVLEGVARLHQSFDVRIGHPSLLSVDSTSPYESSRFAQSSLDDVFQDPVHDPP